MITVIREKDMVPRAQWVEEQIVRDITDQVVRPFVVHGNDTTITGVRRELHDYVAAAIRAARDDVRARQFTRLIIPAFIFGALFGVVIFAFFLHLTE